MAKTYKYRPKKGCEGMTYYGRFKKTLSLMTQKQMKQVYEDGNQFIEKYEVSSEQ